MSTIKRITNVDPLVEEKTNYFLDRIDHSVNYAGWQWHLEIESPTSLLAKIIFRLKEETDYRLKYFDNYFKHSFFTEDTFWGNYQTYVSVKTVVLQYNQLGSKQKDEKNGLIANSAFQKNLTLLRRDLMHKMPEDLINAVLMSVQCRHKLFEILPGTNQSHTTFLNSMALLLTSEYFFRGYTRSGIREIISRVFSKNILLFPFPTGIKTTAQRTKHLGERILKNQFHGFTNVFKENIQKGIIVVKVYGGSFPEEFAFKYSKVKFFGNGHPWIKRLKQKMKMDDVVAFFVDGNYLLAAAEISWYSQDSLMTTIIGTIRSELAYLSAALDRDFSVDTTNNYIQLSSRGSYRGMGWSSINFENKISKSALEDLNDNAYHVLRKIKGLSVEWFLKYEPLFVFAHKNNSISDYWLYLETLLSYNRTEKQVMGFVSSIVLANEKLIQDKRLLSTLLNIISPIWDGIKLLNVSLERYKKIISALKLGKIAKDIRKLEYSFIKELIREYDANLDSTHYKKAKDYYYGIMTEAYEYRNFFIHSGVESEVSKEKLIITLPNIVVRIRWLIFEALKNGYENTPFDLILEELRKKGDIFLES